MAFRPRLRPGGATRRRVGPTFRSAQKNIVEVFLLNIPAEQLDGLMNLVIVRNGSERYTSKAEVWVEEVDVANLIGRSATVI